MTHSVVRWPEIVSSDARIHGLESFELEIPVDASGLLDVWAVPKCASSPEGYWYTINPRGSFYNRAEPGCDCTDKVLLASIRFSNLTATDEDMMSGTAPNVEFLHQDVKLDSATLAAAAEALRQETVETPTPED